MIGYINHYSLSLNEIWEMLQMHDMFQNATFVSLLQNSGMFEIASCAQSVYLLENSDLFKMIKIIIQNLMLSINKGLMF